MEIPSKYNSKEVESRILEKWFQKNCYHAEVNSVNNPFSIVIPPPNVTGILHMGHALNNTIQDVLIRFKRMKGYSSLWMPGTDHAGIATQNVVERKLAKEGLKKEDIGREEFNKRLWQWKEEYGSTIIDQLKKIGSSCDWERTRFTMDNEYSESVKEVFIRLYNKDLIYRSNYIINWCPRCKTALSDEEAAHKELDGWLYYIKYPVKPLNDNTECPDYIVVATTRPETMLGDTAIAINPNDKRFAWIKEAKIILPIVNRELKIIEDEAIDMEFGTGAIKVTPAHDMVDFDLGKRYDLDFINIMNDDATLNKNVPDDFIGMDRFEAREVILEVLDEMKLLEKKDPYKISAGHCYRCHTIIEPRISLQWFVKMKPLAKRAIKAVKTDEIKFYPQRWKKVYLNWMNNIHDWCISRQIWWGHRLPVYYCKKCQDNNDSDINTDFQDKPTEFSKQGIIVSKTKPEKCPDCGSENIVQEEDVLDTWFSSWLWPFATFYWPFNMTESKDLEQNKTYQEELNYFLPTSCLVTASEILFFWVARMIMASLEFTDKIPFKDVIIHGTVRDDKGIKMSKSLGNTIDPLEIIDKFGADALRFSLMLQAASGSDVYLSDEKFLVGRNFSNKVWNATRFIFMKISDNDITIDNLEFTKVKGIDKFILNELDQTIEQIENYLNNYSLNEAAKKIYDFFWHMFCDWYIEIIKDNFTIDKAKISVYVLINSLKLLHPFMPFITEEIFNSIKTNTNLNLDELLIISSWPVKSNIEDIDSEIKEITILLSTIKEIRNIKTELGLAQKKVDLQVVIKGDQLQLWEHNKSWIQRLTYTQNIIFKNKLDKVLYENDFWALSLGIESVDMSSFLLSIDKKIDILDTVLSKVIKKINNEKFLENASKDIIAKEKTKFNDMSNQLNRLKELKNAFN